MKKKFVCIYSDSNNIRKEYLKSACDKYHIDFVSIHIDKYDFTKAPITEPNDIIFKTSTESKATLVEKHLLSPKAITIKKDYLRSMLPSSELNNDFIFKHHEIPTPKIIPFTDLNNKILTSYAKYLNGFPIVVKVVGRKEGKGVYKADTLKQLQLTLLELLKEVAPNKVYLKEYIDIGLPAYSFRAVVLGNEVIIAYKNINCSSTDFRSNIDQSDRKRELISLPKNQKKILVNALKIVGLELGALDFVIKNNKLYIFEINCPFNFVPIIKTFNFPIHEKIVKYLIDKSNA